jgi:beta-N-acetylhexosaminidase
MRNNLLAKTNFGFTSVVVIHFLSLFLMSNNFFSPNLFYEDSYFDEMNPYSTIKLGPFDLTNEDVVWVDSIINALPLYEKCAQVFMPAVFGPNLNLNSREFQNTLELVRDHGIGGIIISTGKASETAAMINELQKNAAIPLLVGADFENGIGMRITGMNTFPHNMALGAADDEDFAYQVGKATALESTLLGVNMNFAPVADINNNPENPVINLRSFSEDKDIVTDYCLAYAEGSKELRVIPTAKHFPGHGNTKIDSHKDLPVIDGTKEYLLENEIAPFKELIDDGIPAIMIGHLNVPAFEKEKNLPATLSYNIITKLLKEDLGFEGLIITDALDMKAVTNYYLDEEAVVKAFIAGNDILLMPPNIKTGIKALYEAVKSGKISEQRLNESVRKILAAKRWAKIHLHKTKNLNRIEERLLISEHKNIAQQIANASVTILKMQNGLIPINPKKYLTRSLVNITNRRNYSNLVFGDLLKLQLPETDVISLNSRSKSSDYQNTLKKINASDLIIVASYFTVRINGNAKMLEEDQINFIKKILTVNKDVLLISFENPYILSLFPDSKNYICTFSDTEVSQKAALDVLTEVIESKGILPVSIPGTNYKVGYNWQ